MNLPAETYIKNAGFGARPYYGPTTPTPGPPRPPEDFLDALRAAVAAATIPPAPFTLRPGVRVVNAERFRESLLRDLIQDSPRVQAAVDDATQLLHICANDQAQPGQDLEDRAPLPREPELHATHAP